MPNRRAPKAQPVHRRKNARIAGGAVGNEEELARLAAIVESSEMALRDREERLQALVTTAADAIITIDERGIIESANPAAERLFGYGQSELLGANVNILMPEPFHSEHEG